MRAIRILKYGGPEVIVDDELAVPQPGPGQVVVKVKAAGVGPWDAIIRNGESAAGSSLPLILGSDLAGTVAAVAADVAGFKIGDEVYGVTNEEFTGAYAEFAVASAGMIAAKPKSLDFLQAASVPVIAVTAWQMLFDYGKAVAGQTVLIHGAAGNVGAYAVQIAKLAKLNVVATASGKDVEYVRSLGADKVVDCQTQRFEDELQPVDIVLDMVGGETLERSFRVLKPGGVLVSVVAKIPKEKADQYGVRAVFFLVEVTTERLNKLSELFDTGKLRAQVGTVLPLQEARKAHEMLAGAPHGRGKIVLKVAA